MEVWKPVVGYEGQYDVSSEGRVRSLARKCHLGRRTLKARILLQSPNAEGYLRLSLKSEGKARTVRVNRLVAMAFMPIPNCDEMEVNHKNGIKSDNAVSNLEWNTRKENQSHAVETGLWDKKKFYGKMRIHSDEVILTVAKLLRLGFKNSQVVRLTGISISTISFIRNGQVHSELTGLYRGAIKVNLKRKGIDDNKILELYKNGMTQTGISKNMNISQSRVSSAIVANRKR